MAAALEAIALFQSTLPREERLIRCGYCISQYDFNPRSHERSDRERRNGAADHCISIHAPTRGATCLGLWKIWSITISIHAPTRGATFLNRCGTVPFRYFNPRSHERSDKIHIVPVHLENYFNPRSHERSDTVYCSRRCSVLIISIHAPTRGATKYRAHL